MDVSRQIGEAPRTAEVARRVAALRGGCLGCERCRGLCLALIEILTLPEAVLKEAEA
jgi:hypothetical protein